MLVVSLQELYTMNDKQYNYGRNKEDSRTEPTSENSNQQLKRKSSETCDVSTVNMKTVTNYPIQQSSSSSATSRPSYSSSSTTPSATPRQAGQRFLPETPKLINGSGCAAAVPPVYANIHQQINPGNNRQLSPGIAKILEDSGNKRHENGVQRAPSSASQSASRSSSSSQFPPSIPKPAARMSLRQKVGGS